ncbi:YkvA family protein [Pseudonocardia pini]|uniref:YkvA family protein n=1 Tax=Pseudonocardia pini TaxID=2758030 RepID=UPI0015F0539E|nr:YkvA family protein [Pseudonocardia pini]
MTTTSSPRGLRQRAAFLALARVLVQGRKPGTPGLADRAGALPRMVAGALTGRYSVLTRGRLAMLVLAVAYLVSPVDLVPEAVLSVFGLIDDGFIALWLGGALLVETQRFLDWERDGHPTVVDGDLVHA